MDKRITVETWDHTDMAEYAAESGEPLGTICLQFSTVLDEELEQPKQAAYVDSEFLGVVAFYETTAEALAAIFFCIGNQDEGYLSQFVLPAHDGEKKQYLVVTINTEKEGG